MHWERTLHAHAETDLSNGEGFLQTRALTTNDDALEDLNTLTGAFDHANVDFQVVTRAKCGNIVAKRVAVYKFSRVHESGPFRITEGSTTLAAGRTSAHLREFVQNLLVISAETTAQGQ